MRPIQVGVSLIQESPQIHTRCSAIKLPPHGLISESGGGELNAHPKVKDFSRYTPQSRG